MTAATHVLVALASVGLERYFTGVAPSFFSLPVIILGSLAPDIDNAGAIVRWGRWVRPLVGRTVAGAIDAPLLAISAVVRAIFGHRGFLHTPIFCALLFVAGTVLGWEWLIHFAWGYATHIAIDCCTVSGVPLLGPFNKGRFSILPIRTGSMGEWVAVGTVLTVLAVTTWRSVLL